MTSNLITAFHSATINGLDHNPDHLYCENEIAQQTAFLHHIKNNIFPNIGISEIAGSNLTDILAEALMNIKFSHDKIMIKDISLNKNLPVLSLHSEANVIGMITTNYALNYDANRALNMLKTVQEIPRDERFKIRNKWAWDYRKDKRLDENGIPYSGMGGGLITMGALADLLDISIHDIDNPDIKIVRTYAAILQPQ